MAQKSFTPWRGDCAKNRRIKMSEAPLKAASLPLPFAARASDEAVPTGPLGLPPHAFLTLLTTQLSMQRLEQQWRALESRCAIAPSVFQSYDWNKCWCDVYAQPDSNKEIYIVAGYISNELVFLMPLMRFSSKGQVILSWMSHPIGQYGDMLLAHGQDGTTWLKAAETYIQRQDEIDCLHLRHIRQTSNFVAASANRWQDGKLYERAPAMDLAQFKTEADYDARYNRQQRARRKQIRKHLEEMGPLNFARLPQGDAANSAIDEATDEKLKWLAERGRFNKVLSCPKHAAFLKRLSQVPQSNTDVVVTQLTAGNNTISWEVGFRYQGTHYCYLTSHRNELTAKAPGRLTMDLSQRKALNDGCTRFDLMVPYDQHKESWASAMEPVNDYYLPLSLKGAAYGNFYLGFARPHLRKLYQRMPMGVLRVLKKLLRQ